MHLAVVDEKREFAGLGEIDLGSEQSHPGEPVVARPSHGGGGDRQQRPAEAVTGGVDLPIGNDGAHGIEGGHDAHAPVVVHGEVAVGGVRIAPGDAEDGVAILHQVADQRNSLGDDEAVLFADAVHPTMRRGLSAAGRQNKRSSRSSRRAGVNASTFTARSTCRPGKPG